MRSTGARSAPCDIMTSVNAWLLALLVMGTALWGGLRLTRCRRCGIPFSPARAFLEILVMDGTCARCRRS